MVPKKMPGSAQVNKKTLLLIITILLQVVVVFENGIWGFLSLDKKVDVSMETITLFSLVAGLILGGTATYLVREIVRLASKELEAEVNQAHLEDSRQLIDVLRTQRHDFLNHLQVIMGYIQLGKNQCAIDYVRSVNESLKTQSTLSNLEHPEVAALVLKKIHLAETKGIELRVDLESDLKGLNISAIDISRILGNLVDNAIAAASEVIGEEKKVEIIFSEDADDFIIEVINKRPVIPKENQEKIFEKGFTTKGVKGSGLGLYIVKEITAKYHGRVELQSDEETGTIFTVYFPKKTEVVKISQSEALMS